VSQSPVNDFSPQSILPYQQGWRALNRLLHEDGSFSGHERHCLFLNCGADAHGDLKPFADVSSVTDFDLLDDGRGVAVSDWDFDGDLDLWTTNRTAPRVRFLHNRDASANHFLALKLAGDGKRVNRDAIGARIELYRSATQSVPLIRTVRAGDSFLSQSSGWVHFGLGSETNVDRIVIRWPGGETEEIRGPQADRFYLVAQGSRSAIPWTPPARRKALFATQADLPAGSERARIVVPAGLPLPEIWTIDNAGTETAWEHGSKGPLFINLWASWCGPCVTELTEWTQHADQLNSTGIEIVALSTDGLGAPGERPTSGEDLLQKIGFPYTSIPVAEITIKTLNAVQQAVLDRWKPLPLPSSFLVDSNGEIVLIYKGPVSVEQLLADQALLRASPEERRAAAVPFPGRWVDDEASQSAPRRVANQLLDQNEIEEAIRYLYRIVETSEGRTDEGDRRELGDTLYFLGFLHEYRQEINEARSALSRARELLPEDVRVRGDLGKLLLRIGEFAEAARELSAAVQINPQNLELSQHLGVTLLQLNQLENAISVLQSVVQQNPSNGPAWYFLANAELQSRRFVAAIEAYRKAVEVAPNLLEAANNLAWILSVHPDDRLRAGDEALATAQRLCKVTQFKEPRFLDTLAVAYAETGQFENAAKAARKAIEVSRDARTDDAAAIDVKSIQGRLQIFETRQPYRETTWAAP
jgi:Flp pilus assembly protein TadD/thiol-disulfide isomerase/thioredoxin